MENSDFFCFANNVSFFTHYRVMERFLAIVVDKDGKSK